MAHIAFFILPVAGHVNPTLGVTEELVARGHRVTYAIPEKLAERVLLTGADVVSYPMDHDRFMRDMVPLEDSDEYTDEDQYLRILEWLLDMTDQTLPALEEHFGSDRPDVVVNDPSSFWTGKLLADRWGAPVIRSTPTYAANEHWSLHPPVDSNEPRQSPEMLDLFDRISELLDAHGASSDLSAFSEAVHGGPGLFYMPRVFQYAGETFDDQHHFVGPCAPQVSFHGSWRPPEDGRPLVVVSLGTLYNDRPEFFRACVEAFGDLPWNLVLVLGGLAPEKIGPVPDNIQVHDFVPLGDVFPHTDLLVNHGGMSTAMEAFSHRVPIVALPVMPEPRATANRIAELGLGARVPFTEATAERLRESAQEVLADAGIRERVDWMHGELRRAGGPGAAANAIEDLLPPRA